MTVSNLVNNVNRKGQSKARILVRVKIHAALKWARTHWILKESVIVRHLLCCMQAAAIWTHYSSRPATAQSRTAQPVPSQTQHTQKDHQEKSHRFQVAMKLRMIWQKSWARKKYYTNPQKIQNTLSLAQILIQRTVCLSSQQMGRAFSCSRNFSGVKSVGNTQSRYPESESWCKSWKFWKVSWAGSRV